jgi:FKBP-type peptidyl-prolyl cis-trans isomerase FklB
MKKISVVLGASLLLLFSCVNDKSSVTEVDKVTFTPEIDSVSYIIGVMYSDFIYNQIGIQKLNFEEFENATNTFLNEGELRIHQDSSKVLIDKFIIQFNDSTITQENANYDNLDDLSYSLGLDVAKNIVTQYDINFNPSEFIKALKVTINGEENAVSVKDAESYFDEFMTTRQQKEFEVKQSELMDKLAENRISMKNTVNGKVTLNSGLQIEILSEGNGVSPTLQDQVTVHYTGKLADGTIFDSSVDRGEPVVFPISGVIPGWTEALQLMQVGSKWNLVIPSDLAYGEGGIPQAGIGPNSTLYFEVELLKIN